MHALRQLKRQKLGITAVSSVLGLTAIGALGPTIARYAWDDIDLNLINHPPTLSGWHIFGTDQVGRDVLSRTLYGLQTTVEIGVAGAGLATVVGVALGATAGLLGGWIDALLMRVVDLVTMYPALVLTLAAIVFFYPVWPHTLILVLGTYMATFVGRIVRGAVAATAATDYVEAARALGASDIRIAIRHILPNVAGTVIVAATSVFGQIVLLDATIEFFSYGMPASKWPSLGNLLADVTNSGGLGVSDYRILGWWTWVWPAVTLSLLLVSLNIAGDALDRALGRRVRVVGPAAHDRDNPAATAASAPATQYP